MSTMIQRLPAILILFGCAVVGAAYFFFEATTVLNMSIGAIVVLILVPSPIGDINVIGNLHVTAIVFTILSMFVFSLPALGIAWVCQRRIPDSVTSVLIIGWLAIFLFLFMFYPPAEPL